MFTLPTDFNVAGIPQEDWYGDAVFESFIPPRGVLVYPALLKFDSALMQRDARFVAGGAVSQRVYDQRLVLVPILARQARHRTQILILFHFPCRKRKNMSTARELMSITAATHAPGTPQPRVMAIK